MRSLLTQLAARGHRLIFKREIQPAFLEFLTHIAWSFVGVLVNASIFFVLSIVAGRVLGPAEYGKYSLVIAITSTVSVLMLAGFDTTTVKYISQFSQDEPKNQALSNALIFTVPFSLAVGALLVLIRAPIAQLLHTTPGLVEVAIAFTLVYSYKNLLDDFIIALKTFRLQAGIKIVEALVGLVAFALFFASLAPRTYHIYLYPIGLGGIVAICLYWAAIRRRIRPWNRPLFLSMRSYLVNFQLFSIVGMVLGAIDRFFVARYLGTADLGLYSAYLISATVVVAQGILIINNVFFPTINQIAEKQELIRSIDRLMKVGFVPIVVSSSLIARIIIGFFGRQYAVHWSWIILVSLIAFIQIAATLYNSVLASSPRHFAIGTRLFYAKPVVVLALYGIIFLFHQVHISAFLTVLLLSYVFDIAATKMSFRLAGSSPDRHLAPSI